MKTQGQRTVGNKYLLQANTKSPNLSEFTSVSNFTFSFVISFITISGEIKESSLNSTNYELLSNHHSLQWKSRPKFFATYLTMQ